MRTITIKQPKESLLALFKYIRQNVLIDYKSLF